MKRITALILSALLLVGALSACSTTGYDGMTNGYNVSTTRDGRVNGTNSRTGSMIGDLTDSMQPGTGSTTRTRNGASVGTNANMTGIR